MTTTLGAMAPGARFALAGQPEVMGVLIRVGPAGAVVRYDRAARVVTVGDRTWTAPAQPVTISAGTEVVPPGPSKPETNFDP